MTRCNEPIDFLKILHPDDPESCFEIRAMETPQWKGADKLCVYAGYFQNHSERLTDELAKIEQLGAPGIYVSLNRTSNDWLAKSNHRLKSRTKQRLAI